MSIASSAATPRPSRCTGGRSAFASAPSALITPRWPRASTTWPCSTSTRAALPRPSPSSGAPSASSRDPWGLITRTWRSPSTIWRRSTRPRDVTRRRSPSIRAPSPSRRSGWARIIRRWPRSWTTTPWCSAEPSGTPRPSRSRSVRETSALATPNKTLGAEAAASGLAVGTATLGGGAGVELDYETVAPAVLALRAGPDVAHQLGRARRAQPARAAAQLPAVHAPAYARLLQQILHPVRAQPALGNEIEAAAAPRKPDLDLARFARLPAPRREIEILRLARRSRARHGQAVRSLDWIRLTPAFCIAVQ